MRFADLHLHNDGTGFLWLFPNRHKHVRKGEYHPWTVVSDNRRALRRGRMGSAYSQADLVKAWNGRLRLSFNGLYPIERGFFNSSLKGISGENRLLKLFTQVLTSKGLPIRDIMHMLVQHVPDAMIDHIQSAAYDYWEFLNDEYAFVRSRDGQETRNSIFTPFFWRNIVESERKRRERFPDELEATGTYRIPKNRAELVQCLQQEVLTMVLTIEGAHAFGADRAAIDTCLARVDHIRSEWAHPVFFVTFAHHFDNGLCGHAHSFPSVADHVMYQGDRMNGPFTSNGWRMIRRILAIDADNGRDPSAGYRMLIDVKHMSARSRKQYYAQIVRPCMAKGDTIPVIASHCGFSGLDTLDQHIVNEPKEKDDSFDPSGRFSSWNINMCKEDVSIIFRTGGLFGLSLDQRILGVPSSQKVPGGRNSITALWDTVRAVLEVVYLDPSVSAIDKLNAWLMISLGSDFGGWIDPINEYQTLLEYGELRADLISTIWKEFNGPGRSPVIDHLDTLPKVTAAVDALCYGNAERFVRLHYPHQT
ncbi:MAG: hypothetical protein H6590_01220 [Flavobacteriales bacterium]|nr:hypothetical protein [Flavobacteriales bacterium]MCB9178032.1 hypothetical protein [Flavobacteriales bacterium]